MTERTLGRHGDGLEARNHKRILTCSQSKVYFHGLMWDGRTGITEYAYTTMTAVQERYCQHYNIQLDRCFRITEIP
jgi:hypothetical protein